jgi:hypothetical protein
MSWVYIRTTKEGVETFSVGFFTPDGEFRLDKDFDNRQDALELVHFLNGGELVAPPNPVAQPVPQKVFRQ